MNSPRQRSKIGFMDRTGLVLFAVYVLTGDLQAVDRDVGGTGSYASIQSAIDASLPFDRIRIAGGIYRESLDLSCTHILTLSGGWTADFSAQELNPSRTAIDGGGTEPVMIITGIGSSIAIQNLTIQNGNTPPGCAFIGGGITAEPIGGTLQVWLDNVVVQDCTGRDALPGGIMCASILHPVRLHMERVVLRRNTAGGIAIYSKEADSGSGQGGDAEVTMRSCLLHDNTATQGGGVMAWASLSSRIKLGISFCTITDNSGARETQAPYGPGGGIFLTATPQTANYPDATDAVLDFDMYTTVCHGNDAPHSTVGKDISADIGSGNAELDIHHSDIGSEHYFCHYHATTACIDQSFIWNFTPGFVAPGSDDFHLKPESALVDLAPTTIPDPPGEPLLDMDGEDRISGSRGDIGADEIQEALPRFDVSLTPRPQRLLPAGLFLRFYTQSDRHYHVRTSSDLQDWKDLIHDIDGAGGVCCVGVDLQKGSRFYHIIEEE